MVLIFTLLTTWIYSISIFPKESLFKNKYISNFIIVTLIIYISIMLVTININSTDSIIYNSIYLRSANMNLGELLTSRDMENGYLIFQWIISQFTNYTNSLYFGVWLFFSACLLVFLRKIFNHWETLIVFFAFINYSFTMSYVTNTIRQGLAISIIFVAISILFNKNKNDKLYILALILAPFFHKSALLISFLLFLFRYLIKDRKTISLLWFLSTFLFLTNFNQVLFSPFLKYLGDFSIYGTSELVTAYGGSNRIDFYLFSLFFIIYSKVSNSKLEDKKYAKIIDLYQLFNIYFLLFGFTAYSDRLAIYSWMLVPVLVFYPLFQFKHTSVLTIIAITLFLILQVFMLA